MTYIYSKITVIILSAFVLFSCSGGGDNQVNEQAEGEGIYLKGTVGFPSAEGIITIEKFSGNSTMTIDTIQLDENYTFNHFVSLPQPDFYRLNFYGKQFVVLVLDDDDVTVNVDGNAKTGFVDVQGSTDYDLIKKIQQTKQSLQQTPEFRELNEQFTLARQNQDKEMMDKLTEDYKEMDRKNSQEVAKVFQSFPPSLASIELLKGGNLLDKDQYFDTFEAVAKDLISEYGENHPRIAEFNSMIKEMKVTAIGQKAPELQLPNPEGNLVSLSSFQGNYVLVDFWAKWCKPCRLENPNVVRAYNKYNKEGFEVLGVSLDRNKRDWVQAIEEDKLSWTHISDLKFWQSEAAKIYNITAIPFALLLDPNGVIIAKNLRGRDLDNKLEEIYGY